MNFLSKLFGKKQQKDTSKVVENPIKTYDDFWNWFVKQEQKFHNTVKTQQNIEADFFDQLSPKLNQLREGIYFLTGMLDENTADLILTVEGNVKNFYFVEELIAAAPKLDGWNFRAHKPAVGIENASIKMADFSFGVDNMSFYDNPSNEYPDEINIVIVHDDFNEKNKNDIINGCYILLDNYLGELNLATKIDNIEFVEKNQAKKELVPLAKLKDFLIWREKEFVEKYEGIWHDTESDSYSGMEATLNNGLPLLAIINTDVLNWDSTASHPWIVNIVMEYNGNENNGFPNKNTLSFLNDIEDELMEDLKDIDGYLNVGRETADGKRKVFFACKEFRKPSKTIDAIIDKYADKIIIQYDIYKDKYWRTFDRYRS